MDNGIERKKKYIKENHRCPNYQMRRRATIYTISIYVESIKSISRSICVSLV